MTKIKSGIEFEKIVAAIQSRFDQDAKITHDERLIDRLGQQRQFDVVIRGTFSGQEMLGVIECKDWNKKVGSPDVDAFVTKSQDINANIKILVSRKGFTKPAINKAAHYGIQTFSLLPGEGKKEGFTIGTMWHANIYRWETIECRLHFADYLEEWPQYDLGELYIDGKKVIDGITNYLHNKCRNNLSEGWVVNEEVKFPYPREIQLSDGRAYLCTGFDFRVNRIVDKREKLIGLSGDAFYDWQKGQARLPPSTTLTTHNIAFDVLNWPVRTSDNREDSIQLTLISEMVQFDWIPDAIDIDRLSGR